MKIVILERRGYILEDEEAAFKRFENNPFERDFLIVVYHHLLAQLNKLPQGALFRWLYRRVTISTGVLALRFSRDDWPDLHCLLEEIRRTESLRGREPANCIDVTMRRHCGTREPTGWS